MRVDPELIRAILLEVERVVPNHAAGRVEVKGYEPDTVLEHIELLQEAGFLEAQLQRNSTSPAPRLLDAYVVRLTWNGQEFLAKARNNSVWERTMTHIKEKGGSVSIDLLVALLSKFTRGAMGLE